MAPGPSRRGTGKSRTKSTSQLPSVKDKHQNTEGIEQKVDKDHQKEDNLKMSKLNVIREQLKICDRKHLGKPSIKKNIFLLTFVNKRGGVWSELRQ